METTLRQPGTQAVAVLTDLFATNRASTKPVPIPESLVLKVLHPDAGRAFISDDIQGMAQVRLMELGPEAKDAIPKLLPLLKDPSQLTRRWSLLALRQTAAAGRNGVGVVATGP